MTMPNFVNEASCAYDPNPDDWFPEMSEVIGVYPRWKLRETFSRTPSALRARSVCMNCPAYDECYEYALSYKDLDGIWANTDRFERVDLQRAMGLDPRKLPPAYINEIPQFIGQGNSYLPVESEWDDVREF